MKITKGQLRRIIREAMDYDPMVGEGAPHVGVRPEYALAFIDASYGDRRMELVVDKRDAELARVVMKKLRKQGQTSGVQPTRQGFHPSEVTSREELLRLVSDPISESIDYSFQNWREYGFTDAINGDPPSPPDHPLGARDAYEDGYQEGLDLRRITGLDAPLDESAGYEAWVERGIMGEADGGSWRDRARRDLEAIARDRDIETARYALPELEDYMEEYYRATLEDAVHAYLEEHGYYDPDSPKAAAREDKREFLMRIGRERGLDKI